MMTLYRILQWTTAVTILATLGTWLVAMGFALAGARQNAETVASWLYVIGPVAGGMLALFLVVTLVIRGIAKRHDSP
jgi:glycerol uptake facilitator-like aquaporin